MRLVVVAGESSGDRAIAAVLPSLHAIDDVFGIGGDAMEARGVDLIAHVRSVSGMGLVEVLARAPSIARALGGLRDEVARRRPTHALLASWSSANARIGAWLRRRGVRVTWLGPPEVWAWGAWRARRLARCADHFATTLPFEPEIWRRARADASYVGHPSLDLVPSPRSSLRVSLSIHDDARAIAILPGSRAAEVAHLAPIFADAVARLGDRSHRPIDARIVVAPNLPHAVVERLRALPFPLVDAPTDGAIALLSAFDAAIVASGTASLECALAGVPPVVAYRMHPFTFAIARRVVRTPYVALPNVVLHRAGFGAPFVERVQHVDASTLAADLVTTLDDTTNTAACARVRDILLRPFAHAPSTSFGARIAAIVAPN